MNRNLKTALIIGGIVLVALAALPFLGGGYGWNGGGWSMMGPGMMGGDFGGGWWWMVIPMVLVPILVIWAIVALVRGVSWTGGHGVSGGSESALEVLRKRYARGDINKQEFEEKRRDLE